MNLQRYISTSCTIVVVLVSGSLILSTCSAMEPKKSESAEVKPDAPHAACGVSPEQMSLTGWQLADSIMQRWKKENPEVDWEAEERKSRTFIPPADNRNLLEKHTQADGHPYRKVTEQELLVWQRETERLVAAGSKVFHSAKELGSTNEVSCDMCHPNAANTHPETYPKYQTQLGQTVLLRDMINWCLENPLRAPKMDADDPRMRAMEAYIYSQRAGIKLEYGKH